MVGNVRNKTDDEVGGGVEGSKTHRRGYYTYVAGVEYSFIGYREVFRRRVVGPSTYFSRASGFRSLNKRTTRGARAIVPVRRKRWTRIRLRKNGIELWRLAGGRSIYCV